MSDKEEELLHFFQHKINKINEESNKSRLAYQQQEENRLKQITPELLSAFLIERGASQQCLSCGSTAIFIPETHKSKKPHFDKPERPDSLLQKEANELANCFERFVTYSRINFDKELRVRNAQFIAHCTNCGLMSAYRAMPVLEWFEHKQGLKDE